jgi:1-deoxy-D-xylulose 5-phosphate reductoisomerase
MTGVLSAANEQSVAEFIDGRIHYLDMMALNEACCEAHKASVIGSWNACRLWHTGPIADPDAQRRGTQGKHGCHA